MPRRIKALRGAIEFDRSLPAGAEKSAFQLTRELLARNRLSQKDVISCLFVFPPVELAIYPCTLLRRAGYAFSCLSFADTEVGVAKEIGFDVLRVVMHVRTARALRDVYLGRTVELRETLEKMSEELACTIIKR